MAWRPPPPAPSFEREETTTFTNKSSSLAQALGRSSVETAGSSGDASSNPEPDAAFAPLLPTYSQTTRLSYSDKAASNPNMPRVPSLQMSASIEDLSRLSAGAAEGPISPRSPRSTILARRLTQRDVSTPRTTEANRIRRRQLRTFSRALRSTNDNFRASLELLVVLHRHHSSTSQVPDWSNSRIMFKLRQQLADPLALVCGALPEWIDAIMRTSHFLFPLPMREQYFFCSAFGCARAVV